MFISTLVLVLPLTKGSLSGRCERISAHVGVQSEEIDNSPVIVLVQLYYEV